MTRCDERPVPGWVPEAFRELYFVAAAKMTAPELDAGHCWDHVERVTRTALRLAGEEQADAAVVCAAGLLHDLGRTVPGEGDHARRSVELAPPLLSGTCLSAHQAALALDAIGDHRYRDGKVPAAIEGKILQDADRLDAVGAIGIARCFAKSSVTGRRLYSPDDPFCTAGREPDDNRYTIDHFYSKLLKLKDTFHTASARKLAELRHAFLTAFLEEMRVELGASLTA